MRILVDICNLLLNEGLTSLPLRQSIILPLLGILKVPMGLTFVAAFSNAIIRKPVHTNEGYIAIRFSKTDDILQISLLIY